ncbi:hypothetical protein C9374_004597 [Naegleria lovaniensis]|uniref:3-hydroxyisobutyrate dehydrogenase n=1 Tax=Naegleria lovaniensis TaxID=51637 RepID=A0AA88GMV6_NAELO|nr:uncharacterized protein C9374_004597 [Naegleria lovaniensis]KAG2383260.1 hypothetical protein C9374_004597 [Naegleria lovaniensis]
MFKKTCVSGVASLKSNRLVSSSSSTMRSFHQSYSLNQHREKLKVGFIGLGQMGARMAPNLLKPDVNAFDVYAYDVMDSNVDLTLKKQPNIKACKSIDQIMQQNPDCVITMLPTPKIVTEVYNEVISLKEKYGVTKADHSNIRTVCIDSSTVDPKTVQDIQHLMEQQKLNISIMDAPVSGGVNGAENATLTFMVGTDNKTDFEFAKTLLSKMGKSIVLCGDKVGMGQVAKLCNNLVLAISMAGVSEALVLGTQLGMDPKVLSQIFGTSTAQCWSVTSYNPYPGVMENVPSSRNYEGGFAVNLMLKDLGLVNGAAKNIGYDLAMGQMVEQLYKQASTNGLGQKDFGAILKYFKDQLETK